VDKLRLFLVLLTIGIVTGPIVGVVYVYRDNLPGLLITPELRSIVGGGSDNDSLPGLTDRPLELPQYAGSQYDPASRTVNFSFSFTNPLSVGLTLNSMSANVSCTLHGYPLGEAALASPVQLGPDETALIPLSATWTQDAVNHLAAEHAEASTISVDLTDISVNIGGISVSLNQKITIPDVPLGA